MRGEELVWKVTRPELALLGSEPEEGNEQVGGE